MKRPLAAGLALWMSALPALAGFIDFDDLPAGTIVTTQYPGVVFSSTAGGPQLWNTSEASSPPNFLVGNPDSFQSIQLDFAVPVGFVALDLISVGWNTVTATAYATDLGTILDSVSVTRFPAPPENGLDNVDPIALSGPGIARLTLSMSITSFNDGFGIDNLSFRAVPEPGTLGLLGLALAALAVFRRR